MTRRSPNLDRIDACFAACCHRTVFDSSEWQVADGAALLPDLAEKHAERKRFQR